MSTDGYVFSTPFAFRSELICALTCVDNTLKTAKTEHVTPLTGHENCFVMVPPEFLLLGRHLGHKHKKEINNYIFNTLNNYFNQ